MRLLPPQALRAAENSAGWRDPHRSWRLPWRLLWLERRAAIISPAAERACTNRRRLRVARRYLVFCGVLPHFFDTASGQFIMFGYVRVLP